MKYILSTIVFALIITGCKKDQQQTATFNNYLKKGDASYRLDSAVAFYDSISPTQTVFSLGLHSHSGDQNFIVLDYMLLENTYAILPGEYTFKQAAINNQNLEVGRFLDVIMKCNSPVVNSSTHPVSQGKISISKTGDTYHINGNLVMNGEHFQLHFSGPIDHVKSW